MRNWGHIDHGFFMINDDTVICVDREFVPECLRDKTLHEVYQYLPKQIMAPDTPIDSLLDPSKGYEQVVVFDTNVLVVDAHNVIFDNNMPELFEFLAGIGITSHVSAVRHRKFWASGIHCMTLDIRRRGKKRKIVNEI
jgi:N-dimethylarginine dimethylaminohydrolase